MRYRVIQETVYQFADKVFAPQIQQVCFPSPAHVPRRADITIQACQVYITYISETTPETISSGKNL